MSSKLSYNQIDDRLKKIGLCLRGGFKTDRTLLLVGNIGSDIWKQFGAEYDDWVEPDPLDNWTRTKLTKLSEEWNAQVLFPFEGPPFEPFQEWATKADCVFPSPTGTLIHPIYGLWHAYRGAFLFEGPVEGIPVRPKLDSPCLHCDAKPCLKTCPVEAYDGWSYNVDPCIDHLNANLNGSCMEMGCQARRACPVGQKFSYQREHGHFHMDRFLRSRPPKP